MSLLDQLSGIFNNLSTGNVDEKQAHDHYDQIAQHVPQHELGQAIGPAMSSMDNQEVHQRVLNSAQHMDSEQRGGLVGSLLGALGGAGGGNIGGILSQLGISPQVASDPQSASPNDVAKLAQQAHSTNPSLFEHAMSFYSAHPTLVKALGTMVIAQIAGNLSRKPR